MFSHHAVKIGVINSIVAGVLVAALIVQTIVFTQLPSSRIAKAATLNYTENFSTTTFRDSTLSTGLWGGGAGQARTAVLLNPSTFPTGTGPFSVTSGDFNGDSTLDLAVANYISNTVSILLGNGDGTFQSKVDYAAGSYPRSVTSGDFNGDNKLDLAVANYLSNNVSILLGNGDGTFQIRVNYAAGSEPFSVTSGDFNGDSTLDLAVANIGSNKVSILLGNGDGTFQSNLDYGAGLGPYSVTSGDFNGDSKLDLAVANLFSNNVSILLGNGNGTFQSNVDYAAGFYPLSVTSGDFNGDSTLDLAVANNGSNNVSILLGNGDGTFQSNLDYVAGSQPYSVTSGDFNGDSKLDLAVANYDSNTVSILLGNGDGTFQSNLDYAAGSGPYSVTSGDFNGDSTLDLAVANLSSNNVSILLGNGNGTFQSNVDYGAGSRPSSVTSGDFNGDSKLDLAVANRDSNNVSILLGNGNGTFQSNVDYGAGTQPFSITSGDFNGDSTLDLAVANYNSNTVSILLGNGDGTFQSKVDYGAGFQPFSVTSGDFNGDSILDLAVANYISNNVSILLGNGDGTFPSKVDYGVGSRPSSVTSGDFNGDSKPDLAVANRLSNNVSILLGNGDGTFQSKVDYAAGSQPRSVTSGDFNGDSKLDLAVANYLSNTVSILLGNGDGTFQSKVDYAVGSQPYSVTSGDFNGDSKLDLAVANLFSHNVSILLGNGDGTFQSRVDYGAGSGPSSVTSGDFNGDSKLDLAVANGGSDNVSIYLQGISYATVVTSSYFLPPATSATHRLVSLKLNTSPETQSRVLSVAISPPTVTTPAGTRIEYKLSRNGGKTWCLLPSFSSDTTTFAPLTFNFEAPNVCNTAFSLSSTPNFINAPTGSDLRYRLELITTNPSATPTITTLELSALFAPAAPSQVGLASTSSPNPTPTRALVSFTAQATNSQGYRLTQFNPSTSQYELVPPARLSSLSTEAALNPSLTTLADLQAHPITGVPGCGGAGIDCNLPSLAPGTDYTFTLYNLIPSTLSQFRLEAHDTDSDTPSTFVPLSFTTPALSFTSTLDTVSFNQTTFTLTSNNGFESGYAVVRTNAPGGICDTPTPPTSPTISAASTPATTTTYTDTSVVPLAEYCYYFYPFLDGAVGTQNEIANVTIPLPPSPSTISSFTLTRTTITPSWTQVPGVDGYNLYRISGSAAPYTATRINAAPIAPPSNPLDLVSFTHTGLTPSTTYRYLATSLFGSVESTLDQNNPGVSATTNPPATPSGLTVAPNTFPARLVWDAAPESEGYSLERKLPTDPDTSYTFLGNSDTTLLTEVFFIDTSAQIEESYTYRLISFQGGVASAPFITTLLIPPPLPSTPVNLSATPSLTSVILSWQAGGITLPGTEYRLFRDGNPLTTLPATQTSYTDTNLTPGTTYLYEVRTFFSSFISNPASLSVRTASNSVVLPPPPSGGGAGSTGGSASFSGNPPQGGVVTGVPTQPNGLEDEPDLLSACQRQFRSLSPQFSSVTTANQKSVIERFNPDGSSVKIEFPDTLSFSLEVSTLPLTPEILEACRTARRPRNADLIPGLAYNIQARRVDTGARFTDFSNHPLRITITPSEAQWNLIQGRKAVLGKLNVDANAWEENQEVGANSDTRSFTFTVTRL